MKDALTNVPSSPGPPAPVGVEVHVPGAFAAAAAKVPGALAVCSGEEVLNYGELQSKANRLANYLRSAGVGPETVVGLYLDRSPELVVSALAVMKAGAAYLPLDRAQPLERLNFMLQDSGATVVITAGHLPGLSLPQGCSLLDVGRDHAAIGAYSDQTPAITIAPDQLAYVIYTSGSTGEPKGVELTHGGLMNLVRWHLRAFQVTAEDRATSLSTLGFDAAVWEIWPYLCAGASLHLTTDDVRNSTSQLRDWLVSQRITLSFLATQVAEQMLPLAWPRESALRYLLTGADVLTKYPSPALPFVLVNNYGPTECTVVTTSGVVPAGVRAGLPSIGRPIDNTVVYLLNEQMRPVPPGEAGELFVGGPSVARGYRHRPDLTAQCFVSDPFSKQAGARLYRTGDLAKLLPSGEIAFLGRADDQVKIRGYRVEPLEVAKVLATHPAVRDCVAIGRDDDHGEKRLAAYVVLRSDVPATAADFREFLLSRLPEYMIPSFFMNVPALPTTPQGKLDRGALPEPDLESSLHREEYVAPHTPVEEQLVQIVGPLLGLPRVGVNDNFFLLGGHSLLGTQLIARVSESFGVEMSLLKLFDHPRISEMAEQIEKLILAKIESASGEEVAGGTGR